MNLEKTKTEMKSENYKNNSSFSIIKIKTYITPTPPPKNRRLNAQKHSFTHFLTVKDTSKVSFALYTHKSAYIHKIAFRQKYTNKEEIK
ncbi:MAG: hypothetical protein FWG20_01380 [Candidatus Cloacimonetes bacterium]|nr:hypothetical protein [Candidatus Cloacimonadota bacterium]